MRGPQALGRHGGNPGVMRQDRITPDGPSRLLSGGETFVGLRLVAYDEALQPGDHVDRHLASGARSRAGAYSIADRVAADVALHRLVVKMIVVHLDT